MKSQWLGAGLDALRKGGVGAVRVERLATDVGVTKGSFYHHFRDRGALLDAMLEFWSREMTDAEFERLQTLKQLYDPSNVLRRNQNIPPQ